MKIKLVRKEDGTLALLKEDGTVLEDYSFESTIDFHLLMDALIGLELAEKVDLVTDVNMDETEDYEKKLISLIDNIIKLYNEKCDALAKEENEENQ